MCCYNKTYCRFDTLMTELKLYSLNSVVNALLQQNLLSFWHIDDRVKTLQFKFCRQCVVTTEPTVVTTHWRQGWNFIASSPDVGDVAPGKCWAHDNQAALKETEDFINLRNFINLIMNFILSIDELMPWDTKM